MIKLFLVLLLLVSFAACQSEVVDVGNPKSPNVEQPDNVPLSTNAPSGAYQETTPSPTPSSELEGEGDLSQ